MLPVFLINLDRSPDRLAVMRARANAIGLSFARVSAVDGAAVPKWLECQFHGAPLLPGEIGCYASHLTIHDRIVREDLPHALILEDDVGLEPDLVLAASDAIAAAPADWDYIHLSPRFKRPVYSIAPLPNGRHLVRSIRIPLNTGGYLISCRGAEKMLAPAPRMRPVDTDVHFGWLRGLDVLSVYPPPVIHTDDMPTTIVGAKAQELARKHLWDPGALARVNGHVHALRNIGLAGYLACRWVGMKHAIARRRTQRRERAVPVVIAHGAPRLDRGCA